VFISEIRVILLLLHGEGVIDDDQFINMHSRLESMAYMDERRIESKYEDLVKSIEMY
jgi:hypothetical protein